jgi:hypothetical protein
LLASEKHERLLPLPYASFHQHVVTVSAGWW